MNETPVPSQLVRQTLGEIEGAYFSARTKHRMMDTPHHGWAVIFEEFDELWDAVKAWQPLPSDYTDEQKRQHAQNQRDMRKEALHVAAMALAFLVEVTPKPIDVRTAEQASEPRWAESPLLRSAKIAMQRTRVIFTSGMVPLPEELIKLVEGSWADLLAYADAGKPKWQDPVWSKLDELSELVPSIKGAYARGTGGMDLGFILDAALLELGKALDKPHQWTKAEALEELQLRERDLLSPDMQHLSYDDLLSIAYPSQWTASKGPLSPAEEDDGLRVVGIDPASRDGDMSSIVTAKVKDDGGLEIVDTPLPPSDGEIALAALEKISRFAPMGDDPYREIAVQARTAVMHALGEIAKSRKARKYG